MARVLVADDDPGVRKLLGLSLELEGHDVVCVADGDDALAEATAGGWDVIVLDVMMPGHDGFEVCRALKADATLGAIPVVLLTAKAQDSDREEGLSAGADRYVTKPFEPADLADVVAELAG